MLRNACLVAALSHGVSRANAQAKDTEVPSSIQANCGGHLIPDNYIYHADFNMYYKYNEETRSWLDHEEGCQADNNLSHLITIDSKEKNTFILGLTSTHAAIGYGRNENDLSEFLWTSGANDTEYTNWYKTEPNSEEQKCTLIYGGRGKTRRGKWHDIVCDWKGMTSICEIGCPEITTTTSTTTTTTTTTQAPTTTTIPPTTTTSTTEAAVTTTTQSVTEVSKTPRAAQTSLSPLQSVARDLANSGNHFLAGEFGNIFLMKIYENDQDLLANINSHGCWCGATTTTGHVAPHKGRPIDYLDKACRDWITCQHCNKQVNEDCDGSEGYTVEFDPQSSLWTCNTATNNDCSEKRCQCDLHLAQVILQTVSAAEDLHIITDKATECIVGGANNNASPYKKNICCGNAPFYEKYSEVTHVCTNGALSGLAI